MRWSLLTFLAFYISDVISLQNQKNGNSLSEIQSAVRASNDSDIADIKRRLAEVCNVYPLLIYVLCQIKLLLS